MSGNSVNARHATHWAVSTTILKDVAQFVTMLALVRYLDTESYGQFALVTSTVAAFNILSSHNFYAHLLHKSAVRDNDYQNHFVASGLMQAFCFLACLVVGHVLASQAKYSTVGTAVQLHGIIYLFEWHSELRRKMLECEFQWRRIAILNLSAAACSSSLSLAMAMMGYGVYALLVPALLAQMPFIVDLYFCAGWRPKWTFSWNEYKESARFGLTRNASAIVNYAKILAEPWALATATSVNTLGIYNRSNGLSIMMCFRPIQQGLAAIYPVLTRALGDEQKKEKVFQRIVRAWAFLVAPICIVLGFAAKSVVSILYGTKWEDVAMFLPACLCLASFAAINSIMYGLLLAQAKTKKCLLIDCLSLATTALSVLLLVRSGVMEFVISQTVFAMLTCIFLWSKEMGGSLRAAKELLSTLSPVAIASAVSVGLVLLSSIISDMSSSLADVSLKTLVGCSSYAITLRVGFKKFLADTLEDIPFRRKISWLLRLE